MVVRVLQISALIAIVAVAALIGLVRYMLRPRRARLDPTATGLPVESMTIPSCSGETLAGWYLAGGSGGGVLLLHGVKSNRLTHVERLRRLQQEGYSCLAIDFQAHGESSGACITLGQKESLDVRSALEWMRRRLPNERLAVLGVSMGGAATLIGETPVDAEAVIVELAFADLASSVGSRLGRLLGPAGRAATPVVLLAMRAAAGIEARRLRPIETIGRLHAPILVLTGADDVKTTLEESRALFDRANPPKEFWAAPGAAHIDLAFAGGEAYWERLLRFLGSTLRVRHASQKLKPPRFVEPG